MLKTLFIIYLILSIIDIIFKLLTEHCLYIKEIIQDIIMLILIAINS